MPARITPCLWFDGAAEAAANHYVAIFREAGRPARIGHVSRYGKAGSDIHGREPGSVMTVEFDLDGQPFVGLNGGPQFPFTEAVSFQVRCKTQGEIDHFWTRLGDGGEEGPCGWLKDRYGLSWQVVPEALLDMLSSSDAGRAERVTNAFMQMKKFDIAALEQAAKADMRG